MKFHPIWKRLREGNSIRSCSSLRRAEENEEPAARDQVADGQSDGIAADGPKEFAGDHLECDGEYDTAEQPADLDTQQQTLPSQHQKEWGDRCDQQLQASWNGEQR